MKEDELKPLFLDCLNHPVVYKPVLRCPQAPNANNSLYCHHFYPIHQLHALINVLKNLDEDHLGKYSIRYLVTEDKQLLLAREGLPGRFIPAHRAINNRCIAAGNFFFSENYELIGLNNESGDFHPGVESLLWPLSILMYAKPELLINGLTLYIFRMVEGGGYIKDSPLGLDFNSLKALLPAELPHAAIIDANNKRDIICIENTENYSDPSLFSNKRRKTEVPVYVKEEQFRYESPPRK